MQYIATDNQECDEDKICQMKNLNCDCCAINLLFCEWSDPSYLVLQYVWFRFYSHAYILLNVLPVNLDCTFITTISNQLFK